jgi:hypothetical protein
MTNFKFFFHLYSHKIFFWLFLATFCCQIFFWKHTEKLQAHFDIVPPAPSAYLTSALSLGDKEFLFRALATRLQNSGDIFAGFLALKNYDYSRLYQWMTALDELNSKSNLVPSMATYYYAQTQNTEDTRYIVNYLDNHASRNLDEKWWWEFQAILLAKGRLKDFDLALKLAYKLSENTAKNAPLFTKQMPAFIYAERNEKNDDCLAFSVIAKLLKENENGTRQLTVKELNFTRFFINERLSKLKSQKFDPRKCKNL